MELPEAKKAYLLIKARIVRGLSIGFDTVKEVLDGGIRRLKELRLYEGSIVTFPMNEAAQITIVKHGAGKKKTSRPIGGTSASGCRLPDVVRTPKRALLIPWSGLSARRSWPPRPPPRTIHRRVDDYLPAISTG